jgi:glycosyltransferase involved in cell wall biosynthesis
MGTVAPIGNEPVAVGLVSVITPVFGAGQRYLPDAYASLIAQRLPSGWSWEWLVQEDGETGEVAAKVPVDDRVRAGQGRHGGAGTARTLALARSRGQLIKVLDADDQLTPGALARDIDVFTDHSDIGWTTSQALDLHADGSTTHFLTNVGAGRLRRTDIFDRWVDHDFGLPVHPATLCIRRQVIMALGGWMALPASEDTGLLIAASIASDGYFIDEPGLLYRKWAGQSTSQPAHVDPSERTARMWIILERALALLG